MARFDGRLNVAITAVVAFLLMLQNCCGDSKFDKNYNITWGGYHVRTYDSQRIVQLVLDKNSGSGFQSKSTYLYGNFTTRMKLVHGDSSGIVTAFYLTTQEDSHHDEVDIEFLGARSSRFYRLQTNVFVDGGGAGKKEPASGLIPRKTSTPTPSSGMLNKYYGMPVRVYKKMRGVPFPASKPMYVIASLWNGEEWATEGGKRKIRWRNSPFHVSFEGFDILGCKCDATQNSSCCLNSSLSSAQPWSYASPARPMVLHQQRFLRHVRQHYLTYTYCKDKARYPVTPSECRANESYF